MTSVAPGEFDSMLRSPVEFVRIDVADLRTGRYELSVTVEDLVSGAVASRSRGLVLGR